MSVEEMKRALEASKDECVQFALEKTQEILEAAIAEAEMLQAAAQGREIKLAMAEANDKRIEAVKYSDIASDGGLDPRNKFDTNPHSDQFRDATKMVEQEPVVVMTRHASLCSPKFAEQLKSGEVFKLYLQPQPKHEPLK